MATTRKSTTKKAAAVPVVSASDRALLQHLQEARKSYPLDDILSPLSRTLLDMNTSATALVYYLSQGAEHLARELEHANVPVPEWLQVTIKRDQLSVFDGAVPYALFDIQSSLAFTPHTKVPDLRELASAMIEQAIGNIAAHQLMREYLAQNKDVLVTEFSRHVATRFASAIPLVFPVQSQLQDVIMVNRITFSYDVQKQRLAIHWTGMPVHGSTNPFKQLFDALGGGTAPSPLDAPPAGGQ